MDTAFSLLLLLSLIPFHPIMSQQAPPLPSLSPSPSPSPSPSLSSPSSLSPAPPPLSSSPLPPSSALSSFPSPPPSLSPSLSPSPSLSFSPSPPPPPWAPTPAPWPAIRHPPRRPRHGYHHLPLIPPPPIHLSSGRTAKMVGVALLCVAGLLQVIVVGFLFHKRRRMLKAALP